MCKPVCAVHLCQVVLTIEFCGLVLFSVGEDQPAIEENIKYTSSTVYFSYLHSNVLLNVYFPEIPILCMYSTNFLMFHCKFFFLFFLISFNFYEHYHLHYF